MKINRLELQNFRGIKHTNIALDGKSTVFFGINGAGKSTILKAINLLYSNVINRIVNNRFKQGIRSLQSSLAAVFC